MLQAYLAFNWLLNSFVKNGLTTENYCVPISIYHTRIHAYLIIDNRILCDPWAGEIFAISTTEHKNKKEVSEYFGIRSDWKCYTNHKDYDEKSTAFTYELIENLITPKTMHRNTGPH